MNLPDKKEYNEIIDQIDSKLFYYHSKKMSQKSVYMILASGKSLKIKIPQSSVAHLLGVHPSELAKVAKIARVSFYYNVEEFDTKASYPLLRQLVKSRDIVYYSMDGRNPAISYERLFSEHIDKKIAGFISNLEINAETVDWVCKYSKIRAGGYADSVKPFDYYIRRHNEQGEVFVLGMRRSDENPEYLVPVSNLYFPSVNDYEYKRFEATVLAGQILSYPTYSTVGFGISEYSKRSIVDTAGKKNKRKEFSDIKDRMTKMLVDQDVDLEDVLPYLDEYEDHGWSLNKFLETLNKGTIPNRFVYKIKECMTQMKAVLPEDLNVRSFDDLDSSLVELIVGYNNVVEALRIDGEDRSTFSDMTKRLDDQQQALEEADRRIVSLESDVATLTKQNAELTVENNNYVKTLGTIQSAITSSGFKKQ